MKISKSWSAHGLLLAVIVAVTAYFCLVRLDNTPFWDDDAQDPTIARNFLATGHFTGWDGRNLYAYRNGSLLDENLLYRNPPLPLLVVIASFKVFGASTWAARLPFALIGIASIIALIAIYREQFPEDKTGLIYAACVMGLSPEFLMNARQCRYYMPCMLAGMLVFWSHARYVRKPSRGALAAIACGSTALFYSNWLVGAVFLVSIAAYHLLFHIKKLSLRGWLGLVAAIAIFGAATVPYAIAHRIWIRPDLELEHRAWSWAYERLILVYWNIREINAINLLPWVMLAGFAWFYRSERRAHPGQASTALNWLAFALIYTLVMAILSVQPPEKTYTADIRFLIPAVPFFCGAVGWTLGRLHHKARFVAPAVLIVLLACNALSYVPEQSWRFYWLFPAFAREVHHAYPTPISETAAFIMNNVKQDETVSIYPLPNNFPVMFYTGHKVRFCCTLNDQSTLPKAKVDALHAPLYMEDYYPDWLISFGGNLVESMINYYTRPHPENGTNVACEYQFVKVLNVYGADHSRPEIPLHNFGPIAKFDPKTEGVLIFRKIGTIVVN